MKNHDYMNQLTEITEAIKAIPDEILGEQLADIHGRINNVASYQRIDDTETGKSNPVYYTLQTLKNLHRSATENYTNTYIPNDIKSKASLIGDIVGMNQKLNSLERGKEDGEE